MPEPNEEKSAEEKTAAIQSSVREYRAKDRLYKKADKEFEKLDKEAKGLFGQLENIVSQQRDLNDQRLRLPDLIYALEAQITNLQKDSTKNSDKIIKFEKELINLTEKKINFPVEIKRLEKEFDRINSERSVVVEAALAKKAERDEHKPSLKEKMKQYFNLRTLRKKGMAEPELKEELSDSDRLERASSRSRRTSSSQESKSPDISLNSSTSFNQSSDSSLIDTAPPKPPLPERTHLRQQIAGSPLPSIIDTHSPNLAHTQDFQTARQKFIEAMNKDSGFKLALAEPHKVVYSNTTNPTEQILMSEKGISCTKPSGDTRALFEKMVDVYLASTDLDKVKSHKIEGTDEHKKQLEEIMIEKLGKMKPGETHTVNNKSAEEIKAAVTPTVSKDDTPKQMSP